MANDLRITSITASIELKKSTYGGAEADNRFLSLKAEVPTDSPGLDLDAAFLAALDMHYKAWEAVMAAETTMGSMNSETYNARIQRATRRLAKFKTFLQEETL